MLNNFEDIELSENRIKRRGNALITIFLILAVLLCLYVAIQVISKGYVNIGGYSLFRVVTGSMEPTIPVGSLLISKKVDMTAIQRGDIICFQAQEAAIFGKMMTHRVVDIFTDANGMLLFETKGDANLVMDGYFVSQTNFVGKVIWYTGENNVLSTVFSFFTNKVGFLACVVFPCLLLASLILRDCVKNIRNELEDAVEDMNRQQEPSELLLEMTPEEIQAMYDRIRAELMEELMQGADPDKKQ